MERSMDNGPAIGLSGIEEVALRLESVCETIRADLGAGQQVDARWRGLREQHPPAEVGAESVRRLARDLRTALQPRDSQEQDRALALAFVLRQLEIALTLLARTSCELADVRARVRAIERELAVTEARVEGRVIVEDPVL